MFKYLTKSQEIYLTWLVEFIASLGTEIIMINFEIQFRSAQNNHDPNYNATLLEGDQC